MKRSVSYRDLFRDAEAQDSSSLADELHELLAVHPAPEAYRTALRAKLLAAAGDESIYRQGITRQLFVSMLVVVALGISVAGLIAWRSRNQSVQAAAAQ